MITVSVGKKTRRIGWTAALAAVAVVGLSPVALDGQESADDIANRCAMTGASYNHCYGLVLAFQAARAGVGLAAAGGADFPGTTGTLGGIPRFALALRAGRASAPVHRSDDFSPVEHETASITAYRATVGVGVFDGFQPTPGVGGVLSLDLMADFSWVRPPNRPDGYFFTSDAYPTRGYGVGARVGLVRESPSRPGVTVSAARRWLGDAHYSFRSDAFEFGNAWADFETVVTSVRAVVGRDSSALNVLGGVGWDRYEGEAGLTADISSAIEQIDADIRSERFLLFGGLSSEFSLFRFSGEVGWARGFGGEETPDGRFDPSDGTFWASLGLGVVL